MRGLLADRRRWREFPPDVLEWLQAQDWRSVLPRPGGLLVETFPRGGKWYLVAYCFEGRNAHQTLGMLLTRRMERAGLGPLGFCASDYVLAVWSLREAEEVDELFSEDMLGDDLEDWVAESTLLRRTFRNVAVVAGLIERRHPGREKTRRQVTFNADLIYDVLRRHEPNHLLLRATRRDAARGLTDIRRLGGMLARARGRIELRRLDRVSPLAVPVLLEIGKGVRLWRRHRGTAGRNGGGERKRPGRRGHGRRGHGGTAALTAAGFRLNGASLAADPSGALWWPEMHTLVVADLHFEKGSAFAAEGRALLPPYDSHATLERLEALARRYSPVRWVSLGDGFHDRHADLRLDPDAAGRLDRLTRSCEWLWLRGNHDPEAPRGFGGRALGEWRAGPLVFRHEPHPRPAPGEVAGHLHPRATVATGRRQVSGRVFVTDGAAPAAPGLRRVHGRARCSRPGGPHAVRPPAARPAAGPGAGPCLPLEPPRRPGPAQERRRPDRRFRFGPDGLVTGFRQGQRGAVAGAYRKCHGIPAVVDRNPCLRPHPPPALAKAGVAPDCDPGPIPERRGAHSRLLRSGRPR